MAGPIILVPKYHRLGEGFNEREIFEAAVHPGRRTQIKGYKSPASWVSDLTDLKKLVILCSFCRVKFNPRKHGYRKYYCPDVSMITDGYAVNGQCDGCKQMTINAGGGTGFIHESEYQKVCIDPIDARRRARARARAMNPWLYIQKTRRKTLCR